MMTCDVCGRSRAARAHPCRFERGCACWRGIPCGSESRGRDSWQRTERIATARYSWQTEPGRSTAVLTQDEAH